MSTDASRSCSARRSATREISPWPGRKTRIPPSSRPSAIRTARAACSSIGARESRPEIAGFDREHAAGALDQRRIAEQAPDRGDIQGRRHHQQAQILAQQRLAVAGEGEAEIGVEAALVELVEKHRGHAVEGRIVEDHAGEDALGDHLDAGASGDAGFQPHAVADGLADRLAEHRRHARGRRPRGQPTGLQDDQLAGTNPGLLEQRERNAGGLAGARRGDEDGRVALDQGAAKRREDVLDRKSDADRPRAGGRSYVSRRRSAAPSAEARGQGR